MESAAPVGGKKKARMESDSPIPPTPNVRVKEEAADQETQLAAATPTPPAADESPAAAAAAAAARVEVAVRIDAAILHCPLCLLPLKPPIFQCVAGHLACGACHGKLTDVHCQPCGGGGAAYAHNPALDAIARSTKIRCPNDRYGCDRYVTYCDVADHQRACPHAPCTCPEPGCGFLAAPPALLDHLTADHSWPSQEITYRAVHPLVVSASRRRLLLAVRGDGDGGAEQRRVFLLAVGAHGAAATVSVSCVRANAAAGPRYVCKVWTQAPPDAETGVKDTIMMEANVRSFSVPGEVAMDDGTVLCVPPRMLHGASMEMPLRVRIDKLGAGATNRSAIAAQTKK
ncbi:putative E3 ubiquitin-protein ligase SINA-like 6 [Oryza glaberrima]|uniref:putative E3 ubiquitin-protein ligase SINA-like 6 n=1 Tax=Oryza glaberrima TaxID=4538 RepID=UPI00224BFF09|nr:putative E3 ubiquitin-protein ligase SINA-like 6 [Oryza glaberrima]